MWHRGSGKRIAAATSASPLPTPTIPKTRSRPWLLFVSYALPSLAPYSIPYSPWPRCLRLGGQPHVGSILNIPCAGVADLGHGAGVAAAHDVWDRQPQEEEHFPSAGRVGRGAPSVSPQSLTIPCCPSSSPTRLLALSVSVSHRWLIGCGVPTAARDRLATALDNLEGSSPGLRMAQNLSRGNTI